MPSERIQRRIDALLDQAEEAIVVQNWPTAAAAARAVLGIDAENEDAPALLRAAEANLSAPTTTSTPTAEAPSAVTQPSPRSVRLARRDACRAGRRAASHLKSPRS